MLEMDMNRDRNLLVETRGLKKYFYQSGGQFWKKVIQIKAVDDVSLEIRAGETLGLVGESGCGKSTLARLVMGLEKPTAGEISFAGKNIHSHSKEEWREFRSKVQIIFQDPYASLNPRRTAGQTVGEPFHIRKRRLSKQDIDRHIEGMLKIVGLGPEHHSRYPHEFSGGQRQRIGIARAISVQPTLIVADEPVSALDVSVQAQILNLLKDLQDNLRLTYLFISHNLGVVRHMSDRVAVMYLGRIVETGFNEDIFRSPRHPYTRLLLSAVLEPHGKGWEKTIMGEEKKNVVPRPGMCRFYPRCPNADARCLLEEPHLVSVEQGHEVACHLGCN
jgi:oligopeptide transport system ATP-binding protein